MAMMSLPVLAQSQGEEPIITFHTTVYDDSKGASPKVSFSLGAVEKDVPVDIDCGFGRDFLEVGFARLSEQNVQGTDYASTVSSKGVVKIYGDPKKIDYFRATGCSIDKIEFHKDLNLHILDLEYNTIKALNIDHLQNLQFVYLRDNPFTRETPLMIGKLPKLIVLEMAQCEYVSPHFDLKNFPSLVSFDAFHCTNLLTADPTQCPELQRLSLDMTKVESVDVTKNPKLRVLNVSDTRVKTLDLSQNPYLSELYMSHASASVNTDVKFDQIDLTHNPELYHFNCAGNNLTSLDISKNPKLFTFSCNDNHLTRLDVSNNKNLYIVNLRRNDMDFSTLPFNPGTWNEYYYDQHPFVLNDTYKVGDVIDLSSRVLRGGTVTLARLFSIPKDNPVNMVPLDESYYEYKNGKITLLKPTNGQVMLRYNNTVLKDYDMVTEPFTVRSAADFGKDIKAIDFSTIASTGTAVKLGVGVKNASATRPITVKVDFGDGTLVDKVVTDEIPTTPNVEGVRNGNANIRIFVPQDEYVTAFHSDGLNISSIDLSDLSDLRSVKLKNADLYSIDLGHNYELRTIDISGNNLTKFSLKGPTSYFYKGHLTHLNASHNKLDSLSFDQIASIEHLDLSYNNMANIPIGNADALLTLNLSHNKLTKLAINHSELLQRVDVSNNKLTQIYIPAVAPLQYYDLSGNLFTLANLPDGFGLDDAHFIYAPQQALKIATKSPGIDLSEQNVTRNGHQTQYVWKTEGGQTLVPGTDYTMKNGVAKFITLTAGKVYCEMSHPALPSFTGNKVLKTTLVQPIAMPAIEIASFTTPNDGDKVELSLAAKNNDTSVYFDWKGDGTVTQYPLTTTYTRFAATTKAGAKVRVLVAEDTDKLTVFSISGAKMTDPNFDKLEGVRTLTLADAGFTSFNFPQSSALRQLNLTGNSLRKLDLDKYPELTALSLNGNKLTTIDLSNSKKLQVVDLTRNYLSKVTFDNPDLWSLDLADNVLESVDLSRLPELNQLWVMRNQLSHIDVSKNTKLQVLNLVGNKFRFSTLPAPDGTYKNTFSYGLQAPIEVQQSADGKVDLSTEAAVGGTPTVFHWFIGNVNVVKGMLQGEELELNDEFTLDNGVTTFKVATAYDKLVCVMTNEKYPNLYQYTNFVKVVPTAIEQVGADQVSIKATAGTLLIDAPVHSSINVYTLDGRQAFTGQASASTTSLHLLPGIYVVKVNNQVAKVRLP